MIKSFIILMVFVLSIEIVSATCTDSDGLNYKNKGYITVDGSQIWDACSSLDVSYVTERICSGNSGGTAKKNCKDYGSDWDCKDGACIQQQQSICTDSDGLNYKNKGYITVDGSQIWDACSSLKINTVLERFCDKNNGGTAQKTCDELGSYYCNDGKCIECKEEWVGEPYCDYTLNNRNVYRLKRQVLAGRCREEKVIYKTCAYDRGYYCSDGECIKQSECSSDSECAVGFKCEGGKCVKKTCSDNSDCEEGYVCKNGECIDGGGTDCSSRCGEGLINACDIDECHKLGCWVSDADKPWGINIIDKSSCVSVLQIGKRCDSNNPNSCITDYCEKIFTTGTLNQTVLGKEIYVCAEKPEGLCSYLIWLQQMPYVDGKNYCMIGQIVIGLVVVIGGAIGIKVYKDKKGGKK